MVTLRKHGVARLPGFPVWVDAFEAEILIADGTPDWKANFLRKNSEFYAQHMIVIDEWLDRWDGLRDFPASRRKFEWQAQSADSLDETVMHLRPSGLRVKRATYVPALVAITQTSILGDRRRRLSPREVARLQGLPEWFDFGPQPDAASYKQAGNGVNVGAAYHVLREHVLANLAAIAKRRPLLAKAVSDSLETPDPAVERLNGATAALLRTREGVSPTEESLTVAG